MVSNKVHTQEVRAIIAEYGQKGMLYSWKSSNGRVGKFLANALQNLVMPYHWESGVQIFLLQNFAFLIKVKRIDFALHTDRFKMKVHNS